MITYKDIKKAVNTYLKNEFDYEIQSTDIKEGFKRPSFFVSFDNMSRSSSEHQLERSLTVLIYFFPTSRDNYSLEALDVQEQLENMFELKLVVQDRKFNIVQANSEVTDGILQFSFDIAYEEGKVIPDAELMQELEYDERVN